MKKTVLVMGNQVVSHKLANPYTDMDENISIHKQSYTDKTLSQQ
jgi:hypothetical protein